MQIFYSSTKIEVNALHRILLLDFQKTSVYFSSGYRFRGSSFFEDFKH